MNIATKNDTLETAWALIILDFRTVSGGKGATSTANAQRTEELGMQRTAFNTQQQQIADLKKAFSGYMSGNQGFNPAMLTALRTNFLNSNSSTYNQAGDMVRS